MSVFILIFCVIFFILFGVTLKLTKKTFLEVSLFLFYLLSLFCFSLFLLVNNSSYTEAIDPMDMGYTPFGGKHSLSLFLYFVIYHFSMGIIWFKARVLPPLFAVLHMVFIIIGMVLSVVILIQFAGYNPVEMMDDSIPKDSQVSFLYFPPIFSFVLGFCFLVKMILIQREKSLKQNFENKFLNTCNDFLSKRLHSSLWAVILLAPVLVIITLILMLLGQDHNSLVKVFTETATWGFSQHIPPPPLDHTGHYLCTVSAKGTPSIVKPIRIGKRWGRPIIVNRQLMIANAFEEMISDFSPRLHKIIRSNYDKYGYNLSRKVNTERASNITYILMKPLEWFFLICLYLGVLNPEKKINKQYSL